MADKVSSKQRIGVRAPAPVAADVDKSALENMARRRLRGIRPLTAGKVLSHPRYWTFPFLRLYLEECDERVFHEPEAGFLLGQHAPELARRVGVGDGPELFATEAEKVAWRVRSLAVWGSCCRVYGELTQASMAYEQARELCRSSAVDPATQGELLVRSAVLNFFAYGRLTESLAAASQAYELFEHAGDRQRMADTLIVLGDIECNGAEGIGILRWASALALLEGVPTSARKERAVLCALQCMARTIVASNISLADPFGLANTLARVRERLAKKPRSVAKMRVFWVEGLLLARIGSSRLAVRRLLRARQGLIQLHEPCDYAVITADLFRMLLNEGEQAHAQVLLDETSRVLRDMNCEPFLRHSFEDWRGTLLGGAEPANLRQMLHAQPSVRR